MADNFARRDYDNELGVESLVPIEPLRTRIAAWKELTGKKIGCYVGDLTDAIFAYHIIRTSPRTRWCISPSSGPRRTR